jgi:hypothetical protein
LDALPGRLGPSERRSSSATPETCPIRRVWEVESEDLFDGLGTLFGRTDLEALYRSIDYEDRSGFRGDALLLDAVSRCARPCAFAEAVEGQLDRRTQCVRKELGRCPMIHLAEWWAANRNHVAGESLAAFFWTLASAPLSK